MSFIGLDVHPDFCEVAIAEDGAVRRAQSLVADDVVAMEATANALAIARIIEPHVVSR